MFNLLINISIYMTMNSVSQFSIDVAKGESRLIDNITLARAIL